MIKLLIGLLAFGTLSTQASMLEVNGPLDAELYEAQVNDEKTYYEMLGDLFETGTLPNFSKISNIAWAGRCFFKNEQNKPSNAGYIFRVKRNDAGPIAGNSKTYEAFSYWSLDKAPNYFDKMDVEQVFAALPKIKAQNVRLKNNSIEIDLEYSNKSNLRVSGNYLVEEISHPDGDVGPVGEITIAARCYYFIPELND